MSDPTTLVALDANNVLFKLYSTMGAQRAAYHWSQYLPAFTARLAAGDRSRVFVALDGSRGAAWRRDLVPTYKANREAKRPDLVELLRGAAAFAFDNGYEVYNVDDCEADDIIAAIVTRHQRERVVIVSSDFDLCQLLEDGRVNQLRKYSVQRGTLITQPEHYYTAAAFRAEYGIEPQQLPAWKAIAGDPSDNLAGIPKLGEKAARAILSAFPTLEAATADRWRLPLGGAQREALMAAHKSGLLAKLLEVTTLRRDCLNAIHFESGAT